MTREFSANHRANNAMKTWALFIQPKSFSKLEVSKKGDNFARYTQIFEFFFLEFSVEWLAFRKFNSFRNFWKLFREFSVPFATVFKFSKVLVGCKALHMKEIMRR